MRAPGMREEHRVGLDYLQAVTALLQRVRRAHPTKRLCEAADLQWWWRTAHSTDSLPQLFWVDDLGRPEAAAITIASGDEMALIPIIRPESTPDWVAHVIESASNPTNRPQSSPDRPAHQLRRQACARPLR